eukprot:jgi/Botrbrau1/17677/Bobra.0166s0102.1
MVLHQSAVMHRGASSSALQMRGRRCNNGTTLSKLVGVAGPTSFNPLRIRQTPGSAFLVHRARAAHRPQKALKLQAQAPKVDGEGVPYQPPSRNNWDSWLRGIVGGMIIIPALLYSWYAPRKVQAAEIRGLETVWVAEGRRAASASYMGNAREHFALAEVATASPVEQFKDLMQSDKARIAASIGVLTLVALLAFKKDNIVTVAKTAAPAPPAPPANTEEEDVFTAIHDPVERQRLQNLKQQREKGAPSAAPAAPQRQSVSDMFREISGGGELGVYRSPPPPSLQLVEESTYDVIDDPVERARLRKAAAAKGKLSGSAPAANGSIDLSFVDDPVERQKLANQIAARGGKVTGSGPKGGSTAPQADEDPFSVIEDPVERERLRSKAAAAAKLKESAAELSGRLAPEVAEVTRAPKQAAANNADELHDAVAVSSGVVSNEEIDLSFIPDPFERENLRQRIAKRKAEAGIPVAPSGAVDSKTVAAAELAASAKALSQRLAPEVAAITSSEGLVDGSAFNAISDPVERASAIEKAIAGGRYVPPQRPSGAARSIPPGSTLALSTPAASGPTSPAKLTSNAIPPPPPPKRKKWWKKLKGWRVAVSRKEAVEAAMKSAMDPEPTARLSFDQGAADLSLKAAAPPRSRKAFPQILRKLSGKTPAALPDQAEEAPPAKSSARSIAAGLFGFKPSPTPTPSPSPPQSPKIPVPAAASPPTPARKAETPIVAEVPASKEESPVVVETTTPAEAKKKFDAAAFFLQQSIDLARANRPQTKYEPADVSRPLSEKVPTPAMPAEIKLAAEPTLSAGEGPIVPKSQRVAAAAPPTPASTPAVPPAVRSSYTTNEGPIRPVGTPLTSAPAPPKPEPGFVTNNGPILPVGATEKPGVPTPEVTLVSGPGPITPVAEPAPAEIPAAYASTKPTLSSSNGPIVPAAGIPARGEFAAPKSSYNVQGPIVSVLSAGPKRAEIPLPKVTPSMISNPGPIRPAKEIPPVWPKPAVPQLLVSGPGPILPANWPLPELSAKLTVLDGSNASLSAGPGPVVPSLVRKMMNVFDLSPKFSKWAPSLEAGRASWGERPLLPMKPAGVPRGTGFGKASWAAERAMPGQPIPGTKMPGMPVEGSTKATIYVGPGPVVAVEVSADGEELLKQGVPEEAKQIVAAKSVKKDKDDDKGPPSSPPPSGPSSGAMLAQQVAAMPLPARLSAESGPVGGLESGWLVNIVMGNRKYPAQPADTPAAVAAVSVDTQDGSSPYLAKSESQSKSGTVLSTGFNKVFGKSTPGARTVGVAATKGTPLTSPRGVAMAPTTASVTPPSPVPSPAGRGPSDPSPPFRATAGGPFPTTRKTNVSGPPVMKQSPGRVDPSAYVAQEAPGAGKTVLAAPEAASVTATAPVPSRPAPLTSFAISDFSDDEEEPATPRKANGAAPVLAALGFFAAAAEAVSPLWKGKDQVVVSRQARPRSIKRQPREPPKYDLFAELLTSIANDHNLKGGEEWSAVRWLADLVPEKGVQKFDVLRQLIRGLAETQPASQNPSKYDIVWDLLKKSRESGEGASPRFDPIYGLLHNAALAADWGLPQKDPVHDLLSLRDEDWGTSKYDPVAAFFNSGAGWHNNVRPKWDPVPALLSAEAPTGQAWLDPVADFLGRRKGSRAVNLRESAAPTALPQRPTAARGLPTLPPADDNEPSGGLPEERPIVIERVPGGNVVAKGAPVPVEAMAASSAVQARPTAAVPSAAKDYDPVPDLIRMQGVFSGPSPAPYDPVVVIVRRGGGLEFMDAARSFRDLLQDEQLSRKYNGVFTVLQDPQRMRLGAPASILARIPVPGQDKNMIESALQSVEGLLADMMDKYPKLYRLLKGRAHETVVDALCAFAALVQAQQSPVPRAA